MNPSKPATYATAINSSHPHDPPLQLWTYHQTPDSKPEAEVKFNPNGKFELGEGPKRTTGQWKQGKSTDTLEIDITGSKSVWKVSIKGDLATVIRPDVGTRYFRMKK